MHCIAPMAPEFQQSSRVKIQNDWTGRILERLCHCREEQELYLGGFLSEPHPLMLAECLTWVCLRNQCGGGARRKPGRGSPTRSCFPNDLVTLKLRQTVLFLARVVRFRRMRLWRFYYCVWNACNLKSISRCTIIDPLHLEGILVDQHCQKKNNPVSISSCHNKIIKNMQRVYGPAIFLRETPQIKHHHGNVVVLIHRWVSVTGSASMADKQCKSAKIWRNVRRLESQKKNPRGNTKYLDAPRLL